MALWWCSISQLPAHVDGGDPVTLLFAAKYFDAIIVDNVSRFNPTLRNPKPDGRWSANDGQKTLCIALQLAIEYADNFSVLEKKDVYAEVLFLAAANGITHFLQVTMADPTFAAFEVTCDDLGLRDLLRYELPGDKAGMRTEGNRLVELFYQHATTSKCLWGKLVSYLYVPLLRNEMDPSVSNHDVAKSIVTYMLPFKTLQPRVFSVLRDEDGALVDICTTIGMLRRFNGIYGRLRFSSAPTFFQHREMEFARYRDGKHENDVPASTPPIRLLAAEPRIDSAAYYLESDPKYVAPCMRCRLVFDYSYSEAGKDDRPSLFKVAMCAEIEGCRFLKNHIPAQDGVLNAGEGDVNAVDGPLVQPDAGEGDVNAADAPLVQSDAEEGDVDAADAPPPAVVAYTDGNQAIQRSTSAARRAPPQVQLVISWLPQLAKWTLGAVFLILILRMGYRSFYGGRRTRIRSSTHRQRRGKSHR